MKSDLDRLMLERSIDVLMVPHHEGHNPYRDYLANGIHASPIIVKKRGSTPVLIVSSMEVGEAAKSGLEVLTFADVGWAEIVRSYAGDREAMEHALWRNIVNKFEIQGRVAVYGTGDIMSAWKMLNRFQTDFIESIELVEDEQETIFDVARRSKDPDELAKLRDAGKRTSAVLRATRDWLARHTAKGGTVVKADGSPLTIGDVKRFVRLKLLEHDLEDVGGSMIFAQGRDAGLPHSRGESDQVLMTGQAIVFDLFPRPIGGGYHHDSTRTWCLGYAPKEVEEAHRLVLHAFTQALETLSLGEKTRAVQELVCGIFEQQGHITPITGPGAAEGYTHSLGHGLGLDIHEPPSLSHLAPDSMIFLPGDVVTVEPGLYYPSKGWGVRIEDTVCFDGQGHVETLTDCPYDLVIPLNG
jgi:Xaa-Pro aminopeptidase